MAETNIEWTKRDGTKGVTWNPSTGCDRISPGCDHCYAATLAKRLKAMGSAKYQTDGDPRTSGPGFGVATHTDSLGEPLRWRTPRTVFVNSMSDLFHARVPREFVAQVFAVMAATPQHNYMVLTKRPERMARMLVDECQCGSGQLFGGHFRSEMEWASTQHSPTYVPGLKSGGFNSVPWPLNNVWVGCSVEHADYLPRLDHLRQTPAAVRFVSAEPLLGPLNNIDLTGISWLICGGESGPGARPMHPDWARSLRDQCQTAGVAYFFKQFGAYGELPIRPTDPGVTVANDGTVYQPGDLSWPDGPRVGEALRAGHDKASLHAMHRVGKKAAGRLLDGREWSEFPQAVTHA